MSDQFVGEIRAFPFNFAPQGWASCNGQLPSIAQNAALFSLVGTTYGGDGRSTFGLPNLQGMAPLDAGQGNGLTPRSLGDTGGETSVTLLASQMPAHTHAAQGSNSGGDQNSPANGVWSIPSAGRGLDVYSPAAGSSPAMDAQALSSVGGTVAFALSRAGFGLTVFGADGRGLNGVTPYPRRTGRRRNLGRRSAETVNLPLPPMRQCRVGGNQAHDNMMPCLTLNFCIALIGIYPRRP